MFSIRTVNNIYNFIADNQEKKARFVNTLKK